MTQKELNELKVDVIGRIASFANCDVESAEMFLSLIRRNYSSTGGMLQVLSDNLSLKGA